MVSIAVRAIIHDPLGPSVIPNCSAMQSLWTVSVLVQEWSFSGVLCYESDLLGWCEMTKGSLDVLKW